MRVQINASISRELQPCYQKEDLLMDTLRWLKRGEKEVVICKTRKQCELISKEFWGSKLRAQTVHGGYLWWQREHHVNRFYEGKVDVFIGTPATLISLTLGRVDRITDFDGSFFDTDPFRKMKERLVYYHLALTGTFVALVDI